jgi:hypothetical protein
MTCFSTTAVKRTITQAQRLYKLLLRLVLTSLSHKSNKRAVEAYKASSQAFYAAFAQSDPVEHLHIYGGCGPDPRFSFENNTQPLQIVQVGGKEEW